MTWSRMFTALLSKIKTQDGYRYIEHIGGCQRTGLGEWAKWVKGVKRYKLLVLIEVSHRDVRYSMVTTANNTMLYI